VIIKYLGETTLELELPPSFKGRRGVLRLLPDRPTEVSEAEWLVLSQRGVPHKVLHRKVEPLKVPPQVVSSEVPEKPPIKKGKGRKTRGA